MNGREGYITTKITQSKKGKKKKKAQKKERGSWDARGVGSSRPRARCLSPWDVGPSDFVYFSPPKQVVASSKPNFWTILYKFIVMGLVRKPKPYNWRHLWESYSCNDEYKLVKARPNSLGERLWWPVYYATRGELPGDSQLNGPLAPCAWPSPPPGVRPPRISWSAPIKEGSGRAKHFQGALWRD